MKRKPRCKWCGGPATIEAFDYGTSPGTWWCEACRARMKLGLSPPAHKGPQIAPALVAPALALALMLTACGTTPDGVTPSWALGTCTNPDAMSCDRATGTTYYCDPPHWTRLTGCPDGGCPYRENNANDSTEHFQRCEVSP